MVLGAATQTGKKAKQKPNLFPVYKSWCQHAVSLLTHRCALSVGGVRVPACHLTSPSMNCSNASPLNHCLTVATSCYHLPLSVRGYDIARCDSSRRSASLMRGRFTPLTDERAAAAPAEAEAGTEGGLRTGEDEEELDAAAGVVTTAAAAAAAAAAAGWRCCWRGGVALGWATRACVFRGGIVRFMLQKINVCTVCV